ncbi:MAG: hypothetical protein QM758_05405 [Armatimonas sp.]
MPVNEANFFFRSPRLEPNSPEVVSQLYLLRRDIDACFGIDPNTGSPINFRTIWPGVMAILAGVDLLGKFLAGDDTQGQVGIRFRDFLEKYFGLSSTDSEIIYQLRNSLLHSFGLYSETKTKTYRFTLRGGLSGLISNPAADEYHIDVARLYDLFVTAVDKFHADLKDTAHADYAQRDANFMKMLQKHGAISI